MKILLLTTSYPDECGCQNAVFLASQAGALQRKGIETAVLFLDTRSIRRKRPLGFSAYTMNGIPVYRYAVPCGPVQKLIDAAGPRAVLSCYGRVEKTFGRPDIIHAHFYDAAWFAYLLSKKTGIPYAVTEHSSGILKNMLSAAILKRTSESYDHASAVMAVSRPLADAAAKLTKQNVQVVPNCLSEVFTGIAGNEEHTGGDRNFRYIFTGRLTREKGVLRLLQAFAEVHKLLPDTELAAAGDGPMMAELQEERKNLGIEDCVHFMGNVKNEQLPQMYADADCFVLPSEYETFSVACIEAMSCGLPVIATRCGGPEEFVDETNGMLVPVKDAAALADAMKKIRQDSFRYDRGKIEAAAVEKYGGDALARRLTEIYKGILSGESSQ